MKRKKDDTNDCDQQDQEVSGKHIVSEQISNVVWTKSFKHNNFPTGNRKSLPES